MANILLRSPQYISEIGGSDSSYAVLALTIDGVLRYSITNNVDSSNLALFEISELCRDYLNVVYDGSYNSYSVDISSSITFYDSDNVQVGTPFPDTYKGFDGYGDFIDGYNPDVTADTIMQSNTIVYVPEGVSGVIPYESSGDIAYQAFSASDTSATVAGTSVTINRTCDPKYNPIKITFVNKFGALQDFYFQKKSSKSISVSREMYKSNISSGTGSYQTNSHVKKTLRSIGNERISVNTGFISENSNEAIKQIMLSEQIWATIDSNIYPINITENDFAYKTSLNDKLINYTMEFEYAFDAINNVR
jgi:hypothetical protein